MNNLGLLSGLLVATLADSAVAQQPTRIMTLEEIFTVAESQSDRLRVSRAAEHQAARETESARMMRLPDISSSLSLSYIADGFTTARDFSDRQKARVPHLGDGFGVTVTQPVYAGGAISGSIDMARLRQDACGLTTANERNLLRMSLTSSYLELYKCLNQRSVLENNIAAARRVLADMHARHDQGTVLMNDITRYELVVSDLELALTRVNNTMRILNHRLVAKNMALLSAPLTDFNFRAASMSPSDLFGMVSRQALAVSMKELFGWLLMLGLLSLLIIVLSYGPLRPAAIFPKWSTIRRGVRSVVRRYVVATQLSGNQ